MIKTKYAIKDGNCGYISKYDYKANREDLYRARLWASLENVEKYLQTDSYRRTAKHARGAWVIETVEASDESYARKVTGQVRTISKEQVDADAARASTRAERRARGLRR